MGDSVIQGTFHFHSTYSHDGKNTLSETVSSLNALGFSFCVMTEHFEDFDAPKLERYVREAHELTDRTGFLVIPGVEVDLSGLHTIVFPVTEYAEIARFAQGQDTDFPLFKILAHPSKYSFEKVARHVEKYHINGVELWNQQADGRYTPPLAFLALLGLLRALGPAVACHQRAPQIRRLRQLRLHRQSGDDPLTLFSQRQSPSTD